MRPTNQIQYIVIHHSAANDAYSSPASLRAERLARHEGYNFIVDDDDALKSSKAGSDGKYSAVQDAPDDVVSNGVYGVNRIAWNICIDGNFEHQVPTADELHGVIQVIAAKAKKFGWRKKDVVKIVGHQFAGRYLAPVGMRYGTACPGKNMISKIPYIREKVAGYLPA